MYRYQSNIFNLMSGHITIITNISFKNGLWSTDYLTSELFCISINKTRNSLSKINLKDHLCWIHQILHIWFQVHFHIHYFILYNYMD